MGIYWCRGAWISCPGCGDPGCGTGLYSIYPTSLSFHKGPAVPLLRLRSGLWALPGRLRVQVLSLLTVALGNWLLWRVSLGFVSLLPYLCSGNRLFFSVGFCFCFFLRAEENTSLKNMYFFVIHNFQNTLRIKEKRKKKKQLLVGKCHQVGVSFVPGILLGWCCVSWRGRSGSPSSVSVLWGLPGVNVSFL